MESKKGNWTAKIKFLIGFSFIILSFILGKIALPVLAIKPDLALLIYIISWVMLIVGMLMCSKEGWYMARHLFKKHKIIESFKKLKS